MKEKNVPLQVYLTKVERQQFIELCILEGISASAKLRMFIKSEIKKEVK